MDYLKPAVAHAILILAKEEGVALTNKQRIRLGLVADGLRIRGISHTEFISPRAAVNCINRAGDKVVAAISESVKLRKGV